MNTKKVYIASLSKVTNTQSNGLKSCTLQFEHLKYVLVKINDKKGIAKDLNTNELYKLNRFGSYSFGIVCLNPNYIRSFNHAAKNEKKYLSKKKVLQIYNSLKRYK